MSARWSATVIVEVIWPFGVGRSIIGFALPGCSPPASHGSRIAAWRRPLEHGSMIVPAQGGGQREMGPARRFQPESIGPSGLPPSTWRCTWCTSCPASSPELASRRQPGSARPSASATSAAAARTSAASPASARDSSAVFAWWSLGITSTWTGAAGLMSRKASTRSVSSTFVEGIWPSTILQNRQSGSFMRSILATPAGAPYSIRSSAREAVGAGSPAAEPGLEDRERRGPGRGGAQDGLAQADRFAELAQGLQFTGGDGAFGADDEGDLPGG